MVGKSLTKFHWTICYAMPVSVFGISIFICNWTHLHTWTWCVISKSWNWNCWTCSHTTSISLLICKKVSCWGIAWTYAYPCASTEIGEHWRIWWTELNTHFCSPVCKTCATWSLTHSRGILTHLSQNSTSNLTFIGIIISKSASRTIQRIPCTIEIIRMQPLIILTSGHTSSITIRYLDLLIVSICTLLHA